MEMFLDSYDVLKNPNKMFERDQYQLLITQFGEENFVYFGRSMRAPHQHSRKGQGTIMGAG
jgi:hypothetical protein